MSLAGWATALALLLAGIAAMQWGASRAATLMGGLRDRYGLPATAGGALMGLATAAPETAVNVSSVAFGWPDVGLGAALGSNVPALPLAVVIAWAAARWARSGPPRTPAVAPQAVEVQMLPYLGVVLLLGLLTLPAPLAGLQPIDGALLMAAFGGYLAFALLRRPWRDRGEPVAGTVSRGLLGLPAIAGGAVVAVLGASRIGEALGIPEIVTGVFAIGLLCALPESFSAWRFTREGQPTLALASVMGDGIVSLTVAMLPLAIVGSSVGRTDIYVLNVGFLAAVLLIWWWRNRPARGERLGAGLVLLYGGGYLAYLAATALLLR